MRVDYHKQALDEQGEFTHGELIFSCELVSFVAIQHVILAIVLKDDNTFQEVAIKQLRKSVEKEETHARRMDRTAGDDILNDIRGDGSASPAVPPSKTESGSGISSKERAGSNKAGSRGQGNLSPKGKR